MVRTLSTESSITTTQRGEWFYFTDIISALWGISLFTVVQDSFKLFILPHALLLIKVKYYILEAIQWSTFWVISWVQCTLQVRQMKKLHCTTPIEKSQFIPMIVRLSRKPQFISKKSKLHSFITCVYSHMRYYTPTSIIQWFVKTNANKTNSNST